MPKRRRSTFKKRRTTKKRRTFKRRRLNIRKPISTRMKKVPFGKKFKYITRYVQLAQRLNPGVGGVPVTYVYNLSSLYDPDQTGAGHQPLAFDQLMPLYDHYHVIATKTRVTATNTDPVNAQIIGIQVRDDATPNINFSQVIENGLMTYKTLGTMDSGSATKSLTYSLSHSKFFGRSVMDGTKYGGTEGSSPNDNVYLHILVAPADGTTDTGAVLYNIQIDYVAILTEPKLLDQS